MDFPYLACHPHQSQRVAVVRQSNKRHELPAQSKERVTVFFKKKCAKLHHLVTWIYFFFLWKQKKWFLGFSITIFQRKNIRKIARFLYHVQVGSP
jgi:hypothetical protein